MSHQRSALLFLLIIVSNGIQARGDADVKFDSYTFGGIEARAIGPAVMGGRITTLDAIHEKPTSDKLTIYVGAADGGVWKSVDNGTTFKPVFDEYCQCIGAVTIDRRNPQVVWVGTGEPWTRNSVSVGDGVYKTTDGGESWQRVGLEKTERISRIVIDPADSNTVYVCALGHLWDANEERGLYKTTDGGKTWKKILYVDEGTGCTDLAIDPQQPHNLYAAMWQFRRWPWFFNSGGPGSGMFKSTDGGETWKKMTRGLPEGELGRIALAVAPSRPNRVYATVECADTALYRSDDLGETWQRMGTSFNVEGRPFYFSLLLVDPEDFNRIYKPAWNLGVSTDGGESFTSLAGSAHPDCHALWINPANSDQLLLGTDGGVYESRDRGVHWRFLQALPLSQYYAVSVDMAEPYNVYGGLQDNGSWRGPSQSSGGIQNCQWKNIGMGDGFHAHVDPRDPDIVYVEYQGGHIQWVRMSTGETKDIQPLPREGEPELRFNWNTPVHVSPTRKDTIYIGAQFLFRTRDRGETWDRLSPDLTTNDPEKQKQMESGGLTIDNSTAENHCTIYAIAESPVNENVIWVGTDDGNLQLTRDGGKNWTNVVANVPDLPAHTWVSRVEPSHFEEGTAYATFDGHRTGDMTSYVYVTDDFGKTWRSLVTDDIEGYCHVVREDLIDRDLLFLGTEFGLYVSLDGGARWARFKGNVPKVSVRDIVIHPRDDDLVLGTHGRGILIIDDVTPLRHLSREVMAQDVTLLATRPAVMRIPSDQQEFTGDAQYVGADEPSGAPIAYYLKKRHLFGDLYLEVHDTDGKLLAKLPGHNRRGINRVIWNMRSKPPKVPASPGLTAQGGASRGPQMAAGAYTVKLVKGDKTLEGQVKLVMDPRADYTAEGQALQDRTVMKLYDMLGTLTYLVDKLVDVQQQCQARLEKLDDNAAVARDLQALKDDLEALRKTMVATRKGGFLSGEEQLREKLASLYGAVNSYEGRPTNGQVDYANVLERRLDDTTARLDTLLGDRLDRLNAELTKAGREPITPITREAWQTKQEEQQ